jgi:hypothetical protein
MEHMARSQAQLLQAQEELKQARARESELSGKIDGWKKDPLTGAEALGLNTEHYLQRIANDGKPTQEELISGLASKVESLEQALSAAAEEREKGAKQTEREKYLTDYIGEMTEHASDAEAFEDFHVYREAYEAMEGVPIDLQAVTGGLLDELAKKPGAKLPTPADVAGYFLKQSTGALDRLVKNERVAAYLKKKLGVEKEPPPEPKPKPKPALSQDVETGGVPPAGDAELTIKQQLDAARDALAQAQASE